MGAAWQQPAAAGVWDRLNDASTVELAPFIVQPFCIVIAALHHSPRHRDDVGHLLAFTVLTFSLCWQSAAFNAHNNLYGY
jgi:hypothetical protein